MSPLQRLEGGLIVSCQAPKGSPLDRPEIIAALAAAAERAGAVGVRIDGAENIRCVRASVSVLIIGIYKQASPDSVVYITPNSGAACAVAEAGADLIALDATPRRPGGYGAVAQLISDVQRRLSRPVIADVATMEDARVAADAGADLVATTLYGHTAETQGAELPGLELVERLAAALSVPVVCEGGIRSPEQLAAAFAAGAYAVVVGTALTGIETRMKQFAAAAPRAKRGTKL